MSLSIVAIWFISHLSSTLVLRNTSLCKSTWAAFHFKSWLDSCHSGDDGSIWHDGSVHVDFLGGGEWGTKWQSIVGIASLLCFSVQQLEGSKNNGSLHGVKHSHMYRGTLANVQRKWRLHKEGGHSIKPDIWTYSDISHSSQNRLQEGNHTYYVSYTLFLLEMLKRKKWMKGVYSIFEDISIPK